MLTEPSFVLGLNAYQCKRSFELCREVAAMIGQISENECDRCLAREFRKRAIFLVNRIRYISEYFEYEGSHFPSIDILPDELGHFLKEESDGD